MQAAAWPTLLLLLAAAGVLVSPLPPAAADATDWACHPDCTKHG